MDMKAVIRRLVALYRAQGKSLPREIQIRVLVVGIIISAIAALIIMGLLSGGSSNSTAELRQASEPTRVVFAAPVPEDTEGPSLIQSEPQRRVAAPKKTRKTRRRAAKRNGGAKSRRKIQLSRSGNPMGD